MVGTILPLIIDQASVSKRGKTLLGPIDLELSGTGLTAILGPNGSGKTTLLKLMHGLERPRTGTVQWSCPTNEAQKKQAFVFQTPVMLRRTAIDNITYPLLLQKVTKSEAFEIAEFWLNKLNLADQRKLKAGILSGGEKQKLALARALATKPEVLFLDEPTANLDGKSTREIEMVIQEAANAGTKIVITTHNIGQGKRLADDIVFLYHGSLHELGSAKAFFTQPKTKEARLFLDGEIVE